MKGRIDIVAASAGSGKTTRLATEIERAVTELGIAPDRIVATTFTKKAAAELIERGRQALLKAGRGDEAELFRAARIGTVNAVAGMIVSDFAFEAGISPDLMVLDDARAREAFRRSLGEVVTPDDLLDLARLSGRFDELRWQEIVRQIADAVRTNHLDLEALDRDCETSVRSFLDLLDTPIETGADLDARLETVLVQACVDLRARIDGGVDKTKATAQALDACERALHRLKGQGALPWPEWAALTNLEASSKADVLCEAVRQAAGAFHRHPQLREDCEFAIRLCFGLARRTLTAYQRFKTERRAIDFVDQETLALKLLQRSDVQDALSAEISLVLVDEFQDVSPLQLALFLALSRISPRNVWVGDQKQAIYGFRGADPSLMEAVVGELLRGKDPETLGIGRRSRAPLVHLTNALFVAPFREAGLPEARVTLTPPNPEDAPILGPFVERWRLDARNVDEGAAAIATSVRHLLDDPDVYVRDRGDGIPRRARPGDVAVLCRKRDTCLAVANRLAERDVASEVARGGLMRTPEGRAVSCGLRLWIDGDDTLARADLARAIDPSAVAIDVLLRGDDRDRFREIEAIARLLAARETAPFAGALEAFDAVIEALRLDDLTACWGRGRQGTANLDALRAHAVSFVRLARHHGGASSPAALVGHLETLADDTEDAQSIAGGDDAVKVMTWHGAKGLEWPIVVLYELDSPHPRTALGVHVDDRRAAALRLDAPLEGRTIRYWPSPFPFNTSRTSFHERLRRHDVTIAAADTGVREEVRLLYVGWTRARDRLILAGRNDLNRGTLELFARGGGTALSEPSPPDAGGSLADRSVTWGGHNVTVRVRRPPPMDSSPARGATSAEVLVRPPSRTYPPARLRPSDSDSPGTVDHIERLGASLVISADVDPRALGTAVHAFLAADRSELDDDDRARIGARLLAAWSVSHALSVAQLLELSRRFSTWIAARWPLGSVRREWPVEHRLAATTLVRGTVDVVVETESTLAIIDHKVLLVSEVRGLESAAAYAGQLRTYAAAILAAGKRREVELLIHLPLSGVVAWIR